MERYFQREFNKLKKMLKTTKQDKKKKGETENDPENEGENEEQASEDQLESDGIDFEEKVTFAENVRKLNDTDLGLFVKMIKEKCSAAIHDLDAEKLQIKLDDIDKDTFYAAKKLVEDNFYDSVLFHRVIERFMIQAGDPDSKGAPADVSLGSGGLSYTVPAEFHPNLFHKRGALGAARDGNPARASSSTQFYIVQGRVYTDSLLIAQEKRINGWLAMNRVVNDSANLELIETRNRLWEEDKEDSAQLITDELNRLRDLDLETAELYVIPEPHREIYKSVGGAAHLDQNYTVYGEVIEGMDIVDQIAAVATNDANRPVEDVRIITTKLVERK